MKRRWRPTSYSSAVAVSGLIAAACIVYRPAAEAETSSPSGASFTTATPTFLEDHCARCHNDEDKAAGLTIADLKGVDLQTGIHPEEWEKILRRVSNGEMPPLSKPQPTPEARASFVNWLQASLDRYGAAHPDPAPMPIRRLNRIEYANAVRDLFALKADFSRELPLDSTGYGFDNNASVLTVSPTLMDRYVVVAGKVARQATGLTSPRPFLTAYQVPKDGSFMNAGRPAYNERMSEDLPLGSRGGGAFNFYARYDATYEIGGFLNANTDDEADREKADRIAVKVPLKAGPHVIGMAFRRQLSPDESVQTVRNTANVVPLPTDPPTQLTLDVFVDGARVREITVDSYRMSPGFSQKNWPRDVMQIDVTGPFKPSGAGNTASRAEIFTCKPKSASAETACATSIIGRLARRAYRRPVTDADIAPLMQVYAEERKGSNFEQGIEAALEAILVSPSFLFVVERDPKGAAPGTVYRVSDLDLASRLSLFLWSSIPDETLLALAEKGRLHEPAVLEAQIGRMLADPRGQALTNNFASQWLYLRNLDQQRPDPVVFPKFDERLRSAMARETEMFFDYVVRTNRSVLDFIAADYTFLNARLAEHYGIKGVNGTSLRLVSLGAGTNRGGLLGQASILTVTSYGNHTSVVKRGKWILDNMLSAPPPAPPPDIPALRETVNGRVLTAREQLEMHRDNPSCASCHSRIDPLGFSLENFDALGVYRRTDAGSPIDASATMPNGVKFTGLPGLQKVLLDRKDEFTAAFTERLMTYALARGVVARDMPAVRKITRNAAADDYRIQTIIKGIVESDSFQLRKVAVK